MSGWCGIIPAPCIFLLYSVVIIYYQSDWLKLDPRNGIAESGGGVALVFSCCWKRAVNHATYDGMF